MTSDNITELSDEELVEKFMLYLTCHGFFARDENTIAVVKDCQQELLNRLKAKRK